MIDNSLHGKYEHYKNKKFYEIIHLALHSETKEEMLVYRALYKTEEFDVNQIWVRPKSMFFEEVIHDGIKTPRFKK